MKNLFVIFLSLFLTVGVTDASAQSFLKKLSKAVKKEVENQVVKEVSNQVGKGVEKGIDKLTDGKKQQEQQQAQQQVQLQVQQTEQVQQAEQVQQPQPEQAQQPQPEQAPAQPAPTQEPKAQSWWEKTSKPYAINTIDAVIPYGPTSGELGGHQWVDLGLPSGTRWATCNVDAASPEQPGKHYSWGEVATKTSYTEANTKYYKKDVADFSGDKVSDVATAKWGAGWRTPTQEEFQELVDYCNWDYEQRGGRWGAKLTSIKNGKSIFLPATGSKEGTSIDEPNGCGMYWTSTPMKDNVNTGAHEYHFGGALGEMGVAERYYGFAIRPVADYGVKVEVPSSGEIEGHKWVDLGLPSGLKWATCNLGTESADQDGEYFAWGETITRKEGTKNKLSGKTCPNIAGAAQYDAARALWGGTWRLPMADEFIELIENCTLEWTSIGRRSGVKVTSKVNGNYIFFPASGRYAQGDVRDINSIASYWSSTPLRTLTIASYAFCISKSQVIVNSVDRIDGISIRPVSE